MLASGFIGKTNVRQSNGFERGADRQTAMTLDPIDGPAKLNDAIGKESILQTSSGFTVSISAKLKTED
jgi:hypothetical protein